MNGKPSRRLEMTGRLFPNNKPRRNQAFLATLLGFQIFAANVAFAGESEFVLKNGAGKNTLSLHCAICHSLDYIKMNSPFLDRAGWDKTLTKMTRLGASFDDAEKEEMLGYLVREYGK